MKIFYAIISIMEERKKRIGRATLAFIGTSIGAGVFGLPSLFSYVGFWPGTVLFLLVALVMWLTHLYSVELILHFKKPMRLPGMAKAALGEWGFVAAGVTYPLQIIGVNLIYVILGGTFLSSLAHSIGIGLPLVFWQLLFWAIVAVIVLFGLKLMSRVEAWATWLLIGSMVLVVGLSAPKWEFSLLPRADWSNFFLPFGVFLFTLSGLSVVGEIVELVDRKRSDARWSVSVGMLVSVVLSWVFGVGMYLAAHGVIGRDPSALIGVLPGAWSWFIPLFGFLAIITSYLTTAEDLKASFHLDFHLKEAYAWLVAVGAPLILLFTQRDFLTTVDVVGTVFGGINALLVIFMAMKLFVPKKIPPRVWSFFGSIVLLLVFMIGILHKLLYKPLI